METRIKTGKDLKCEYTGEKNNNALIKIYPVLGDGDAGETKWMGRDVLANALGMIDSLLKPQQPQPVMQQPQQHQGNVAPIAPRVVGQSVKDPAEVVNAFRNELLELIKNPPKSRDAEQAGLGEMHVRDLIKTFMPTFKNPNAMLPVLQKELGMDRGRFDIVINMIKSERSGGNRIKHK